MDYSDLERLEDEVESEFIPSGSVLSFVPGGDMDGSGIPGKRIEDGKLIGVVRTWGGDRRVDRKVRIVDEEIEEKRDFYYEGKLFFSEAWESSIASWDGVRVMLPEGFEHSLHSYIELLLTTWSFDDINEVWWEQYQLNHPDNSE